MTWKTRFASIGIAAIAASLTAQETAPPANTTPTQTQTQTTTEQRDNMDGTATTSTKTTTTTVSGEVVRYEPGRTIVIRDPSSRMVTYTLDGGLTVPADVQVGRKVTIYSSPADGSVRVQRITTVTSATAGGAMSTKTEVRDEAPPASGQTTATQSTQTSSVRPDGAAQTTTTTKTTRVSGTVRAYEPGQSITILGPGNKVTTYTVTTDSQLPADVAIGKQVTIQTSIVSGKPVARSVTYRTTTKTTQSKTVPPQ